MYYIISLFGVLFLNREAGHMVQLVGRTKQNFQNILVGFPCWEEIFACLVSRPISKSCVI